MNLTLSFDIEKYAISRTIKDYTTDYYIANYAEKLIECSYPLNEELIIILLSKLSEWYTKEISTIMKGEYIHSKESHKKSFDLIRLYLNKLVD